MKSTMSQDLALLSIENERARMINVAKIEIFLQNKRLEKTEMPGHCFNYCSSIVL